MSIKIDIAFTLDPDWDCPSQAIMNSVKEILEVEGEFPGFLGDRLEVYRRVERGRFTAEDYAALHNAEELMRMDVLAYLDAVGVGDDPEMEKVGRISTAVTSARDIQEVFVDKTAGRVTYSAEEGTTNIFNKLTRQNEELAKQDGSALGLFSGKYRRR